LIKGVAVLLSPQGHFCTIIPFKEELPFLELCAANSLYPNKITRVRGNPGAPLKRSLLQLSRKKGEPVLDELTIELGRHEYTGQYRQLTADFYLKM
jgi:tRNA1Val (adenine37-N6)-methyltransferase